ncbi:RNA polymerase sigma-70 factor, ECF subfamily [Maribacter aquivivus]|uniref:RNA polymerase sigma-70 factor, ECF subfamily n=1 Tax=Maribacter aquivivus TaxID=228958 RepID=A0A1M6KNS2_9FLAO|nr:RNA polymerase sigma factor [Maribacter aquivivus]SHJ60658.1 RNA polymerase sigma-70 factor, ECF subfamily [Maribacter aquivivus]
MSLEELIHNCKKGDRKAQELLYRAYATTLYGICLKYSKSKSQAEDTLHDSFMTIYDKIGQFKNKGSFEGWMKRITVNTALQKYRKQEYLNVVTDNTEEEVTVDNVYDDISLQTLLGYIQELPNKYRATFNLYVLDGYTHKEISELLGTTIGTSKSNLARARALLKEKIETKITQSIVSILIIISTHFL